MVDDKTSKTSLTYVVPHLSQALRRIRANWQERCGYTYPDGRVLCGPSKKSITVAMLREDM